MEEGPYEKLKEQALEVQAPKSYFRGRTPEKLSLTENLLIFTRTTREGLQQKTFELRPHPRFVLVLALECEGMVSIDGKAFHLPEQHGLLVFPYQFHQFIEIKREDILWLIITFEFPEPNELSAFRDEVFSLTPRLQQDLLPILKLYNQPPSEGNDAEILLRATLLLHELRAAVMESRQRDIEPLVVEEGKGRSLLAKIERELARPDRTSYPKTAELAEKVGYSESRLRAVFKEYTGVSLGSYLRNYQIHQAIKLLRNPSMSLSKVAVEAGFNSTSSFCRAFKAHTRATPREYRERLREMHPAREINGRRSA